MADKFHPATEAVRGSTPHCRCHCSCGCVCLVHTPAEDFEHRDHEGRTLMERIDAANEAYWQRER